ncbi:MAG: glycosyl transferase, partial [Gemmatimonadales bacterium]
MRRLLLPLAVTLLIAAAIGRIALTSSVFNQTWDEPAHVAAGMEWLSRGTYSYEPLHPPLARVMVALGPYLDGLRTVGYESVWIEGNALLYGRHAYIRNLTFARLGVLPFFVMGALAVFFWARHLFGRPVALLATLLFTTLPPVLAHA